MGKLLVLALRNFVVHYDELVDGKRQRKTELLLSTTKGQAIRMAEEKHREENKKTSNYVCSKAGKAKE